MLLKDRIDNNKIIDYDIYYDDESKKTILEILSDSCSKISISESLEVYVYMYRYT